MLAFSPAKKCATVKKSTEFGDYLDPLSVLDYFKLDYGDKSIIVDSTLKEIYASPFPGFNRIVEIPLEKLASTACKKVDISTFVYFNLMCNVDRAHAIAASGLSGVMPFVNKYFESVSSDSFYPEILDLYNIWNGLCSQKPEVVIEIGGGVSTSLISYYCSNFNAKHILIDPEEYWVQNTFSGLEKCGLTPPFYSPLQVIEKDATKAVGIDFANSTFDKKTYYDFDYANTCLLDNISNSSKKLVFVDANCDKSFFQGGEIFIDPVMSPMLSNSLILVDWRLRACTLLSGMENIKSVYSTNTEILFDKFPSVGRMINYGFSAFTY